MFKNKFDVYMMAEGDYGSGGGTPSFNLPGVGGIDSSQAIFVESSHSFVDPPRYFKANDPYYYEIDNLPLKQLQENCLWLRDQVQGVTLDLSGISVAQISDLKPYVTNSDRVLYVKPGKFTGRVNDAYNLDAQALFSVESPSITDMAATRMFTPATTRISDAAFAAIVGNQTATLFYGNGLYDTYQTHAAEPELGSILGITGGPITTDPPVPITINYTPQFLNSDGLSMETLPKIRSAYWQQISSTTAAFGADLQQLAVDFCRRWGGAIRTSVVSVLEELSVEISPFNPTDYLDNNPSFEPQVRIDLVFVYTHPIDASKTSIARNAGGGPEVLTAPRLGVVRGAGSILTSVNNAVDIASEPSLIAGAQFQDQLTESDKAYIGQQNLEGEDLGIISPLQDQSNDNPFGLGQGGSFPSPDDLMNLAPILGQDAMESSLATVGQSVLPLCYVVVKKDTPIVMADDIIDIRPFLRTTELTYNERAGVAAATPPLSLANPSVGKIEMFDGLQLLRDYLLLKTDIKIQDFINSIVIPEQQVLILQPRFTAGIHQDFGTGPTQVSLGTTNTATINQGVQAAGDSLYYDIHGDGTASDKIIKDIAMGDPTFFLAQGIYYVDVWIGGEYGNNSNTELSYWTLTLERLNDSGSFVPVAAHKSTRQRLGNNRELNPNVSMRTYVSVPDGTVGYEEFRLSMKRASGANVFRGRGNVTVERLSNTDNSLTAFKWLD